MSISLFFHGELLRTICGLILVMIPGILLTYLILPDKRPMLRIALGIGLAPVLLGWLLLLLSLLKIEITSFTVAIGFSILWVLEILLIFIFRRLSFSRLFVMFNNIKIIINENIASIFVLILFLLTLIIVLPIAQAKNEKGYTEFYLNEGFDLLPPWRRTYNVADNVLINLAVKSNEKSDEPFEVKVLADGATLEVIDLGLLKPGQSILEPITISLSPMPLQRYDFVLYKGGSIVPYRAVHFWLRVNNNYQALSGSLAK